MSYRTKNITAIRAHLVKKGWKVDSMGFVRVMVVEDRKNHKDEDIKVDVEIRCRFRSSIFWIEKRAVFSEVSKSMWTKVKGPYLINGYAAVIRKNLLTGE